MNPLNPFYPSNHKIVLPEEGKREQAPEEPLPIDASGLVSPSLASTPFRIDARALARVEKFLSQTQFFPLSDPPISIRYRLIDLMRQFSNCSIEITGTAAFAALGRGFFKRLFSSQEIPADRFLQAFPEELNDIDLRMWLPPQEEPRSYTSSLISHFVIHAQKTLEEICKRIDEKASLEELKPFFAVQPSELASGEFKQLRERLQKAKQSNLYSRIIASLSDRKLLQEQSNELAMISAGPKEGLRIDFLFCKKLQRRHLFSSDNFRLLIHFEGQRLARIEAISDGNCHWQAMIDRFTKTLRIDELESVNYKGWIAALSKRAKGWKWAGNSPEKALLEKTLKGCGKHLGDLIQKTLRDHHQNDPEESLLLLKKALLSLTSCGKLSEIDFAPLLAPLQSAPHLKERLKKLLAKEEPLKQFALLFLLEAVKKEGREAFEEGLLSSLPSWTEAAKKLGEAPLALKRWNELFPDKQLCVEEALSAAEKGPQSLRKLLLSSFPNLSFLWLPEYLEELKDEELFRQADLLAPFMRANLERFQKRILQSSISPKAEALLFSFFQEALRADADQLQALETKELAKCLNRRIAACRRGKKRGPLSQPLKQGVIDFLSLLTACQKPLEAHAGLCQSRQWLVKAEQKKIALALLPLLGKETLEPLSCYLKWGLLDKESLSQWLDKGRESLSFQTAEAFIEQPLTPQGEEAIRAMLPRWISDSPEELLRFLAHSSFGCEEERAGWILDLLKKDSSRGLLFSIDLKLLIRRRPKELMDLIEQLPVTEKRLLPLLSRTILEGLEEGRLVALFVKSLKNETQAPGSLKSALSLFNLSFTSREQASCDVLASWVIEQPSLSQEPISPAASPYLFKALKQALKKEPKKKRLLNLYRLYDRLNEKDTDSLYGEFAKAFFACGLHKESEKAFAKSGGDQRLYARLASLELYRSLGNLLENPNSFDRKKAFDEALTEQRAETAKFMLEWGGETKEQALEACRLQLAHPEKRGAKQLFNLIIKHRFDDFSIWIEALCLSSEKPPLGLFLSLVDLKKLKTKELEKLFELLSQKAPLCDTQLIKLILEQKELFFSGAKEKGPAIDLLEKLLSRTFSLLALEKSKSPEEAYVLILKSLESYSRSFNSKNPRFSLIAPLLICLNDSKEGKNEAILQLVDSLNGSEKVSYLQLSEEEWRLLLAQVFKFSRKEIEGKREFLTEFFQFLIPYLQAEFPSFSPFFLLYLLLPYFKLEPNPKLYQEPREAPVINSMLQQPLPPFYLLCERSYPIMELLLKLWPQIYEGYSEIKASDKSLLACQTLPPLFFILFGIPEESRFFKDFRSAQKDENLLKAFGEELYTEIKFSYCENLIILMNQESKPTHLTLPYAMWMINQLSLLRDRFKEISKDSARIKKTLMGLIYLFQEYTCDQPECKDAVKQEFCKMMNELLFAHKTFRPYLSAALVQMLHQAERFTSPTTPLFQRQSYGRFLLEAGLLLVRPELSKQSLWQTRRRSIPELWNGLIQSLSLEQKKEMMESLSEGFDDATRALFFRIYCSARNSLPLDLLKKYYQATSSEKFEEEYLTTELVFHFHASWLSSLKGEPFKNSSLSFCNFLLKECGLLLCKLKERRNQEVIALLALSLTSLICSEQRKHPRLNYNCSKKIFTAFMKLTVDKKLPIVSEELIELLREIEACWGKQQTYREPEEKQGD